MLTSRAFSTGYLLCFQERRPFFLSMKQELLRTSAYCSSVSLSILHLFLYSRLPSSIGVSFSVPLGSEAVRRLLLVAASILRATKAVYPNVMQLSFLTRKAVFGLSPSTNVPIFAPAERSGIGKIEFWKVWIRVLTLPVWWHRLSCSEAARTWSSGMNSALIAASNLAHIRGIQFDTWSVYRDTAVLSFERKAIFTIAILRRTALLVARTRAKNCQFFEGEYVALQNVLVKIFVEPRIHPQIISASIKCFRCSWLYRQCKVAVRNFLHFWSNARYYY